MVTKFPLRTVKFYSVKHGENHGYLVYLGEQLVSSFILGDKKNEEIGVNNTKRRNSYSENEFLMHVVKNMQEKYVNEFYENLKRGLCMVNDKQYTFKSEAYHALFGTEVVDSLAYLTSVYEKAKEELQTMFALNERRVGRLYESRSYT